MAALIRSFFTKAMAPVPRKVAVVGAAGGIGQPLSMLLKLNPNVTELALYDIVGTKGVAADLSHINTGAKVTGYVGADELGAALKDADVIVIPAGVPRKPGMTRDDLFNINAGIVKGIAESAAVNAPKAIINVISNPVNSTVPIFAETLKKAGTFDPKRLLGVTTLDVVRAKTFYAGIAGVDVNSVTIPVIGGHAGITILPLFSQATPKVELTPEQIDALTKRTQDGGTEVVEAKAGAGSATLSMAYAGAIFADAVLRGLNGEKDVIEPAYVASTITDVPYFATKVRLGTEGIEEILGIGDITAYEKEWLEKLQPELLSSIQKGIDFVASKA